MMQFDMNHVIILDDEEPTREMMLRVARSIGYSAVGVSNRAAFEISVADQLPTIVVLDLVLGREDIWPVIDFLRKRRYAGGVILTSGYDHRLLELTSAQAREHGMQVVGTVEKGLGQGKLGQLLERQFVGARPAKPTEQAAGASRAH